MADNPELRQETMAWEECVSACKCDVCSVFYPGCCALLSFIENSKHSTETSRDDCYLQRIEENNIDTKPAIKTENQQCELCGQDLQDNEGFILFNSDLNYVANKGITRRQCVVCYMEHCTGKSSDTGKGHWIHLEDEASHTDILSSFERDTKEDTEEEHNACVQCQYVSSSHQDLECHKRLQHDSVTYKYTHSCNSDCYPDIESRPEMKLSPLHTCMYDDRYKDHSHTNHTTSDFETTIWTLLNGCHNTMSCKLESTEYTENDSVEILGKDRGLTEDHEDRENLPAPREDEGLGIRIVEVWSEAPGYSEF